MTRGLIVDLFAGGGGASTGIEAALGRPVDIAINHSARAIAVHEANHPGTRHFTTNVWEVEPIQATRGEPVDLLWGSPDCFPAGTLILTPDGYVPIEEVHEGDLVLTHRCRWRRVTSTMQTAKRVHSIRGHGHPGLRVSSEHPLLTKTRTTTRSYRPSRTQHAWSAPEWTPAAQTTGRYWCTPTRVLALPVPAIGGRGLPLDARLWWLVGRYLADGWTRLDEDRAELVICCGPAKHDATQSRLDLWPRAGKRADGDELAWHERRTATEFQFSTNHRGLVAWLREHFGHLAHGKRIPGWALGMAEPDRRALLDGYLAGDGWSDQTIVESTTVSRALAFGLRSLAATLGYVPTVYVAENRNVIEGRTVNVRPTFRVKWRHDVVDDHKQHEHDHEAGHLFTPIRDVSVPSDVVERVFNLSVDEDESYVAEGVVVHNCTHFSRAKGSRPDRPKSRKIRSLAWVIVRWARAVRPRVILMENVLEFLSWGPLDAQGQPVARRIGRTFREWVRQLARLGYEVEWRELDASRFGAPTRRKRLFVVARCDGEPIRWPQPTHGPGLLPYRTAGECIDWSVPTRSIFDRKKPLAEKTLHRIAEGIRRFVIESPRPYIVRVNHGRDEHRGQTLDEPLTTVEASRRGHALAVPYLVNTRNGERAGQTPRVRDVADPAPTVTAKGSQGAIAAVALVDMQRENAPRSLEEPLGVVTTQGNRFNELRAAFVARHYGGMVGDPADRPLATVTARDHHSPVAATLVKLRGECHGASLDEPMPTVTAQGLHLAECRAFLTKFYGAKGTKGASLFDGLPTATAKARFGLVVVDGVEYEIGDIFLRMLEPHELLRAQFGEFADGYDLSAARTKEAKTRLVGNSVCPHVAAALVRVNVVEARGAVSA